MAAIRVTLLASSNRPSRSSSPSRSRAYFSSRPAGARRSPWSKAAMSSSTTSPSASSSEYPSSSSRSSSSGCGPGSDALMAEGAGSAPVAVLPRADVPGGVQRHGAQRAGGPAGGDGPAGAGDEGAGRGGGDRHPQRVGALIGVGEDRVLLDRLLAGGDCLDDDGVLLAVPGQAHRGDPELLVDRRGQRVQVVDVGVGRDDDGGPVGDLVEQLAHPVGEHLHL